MQQIALDIGLASGPSLTNFLAGPNLAALQHIQLWVASDMRSPVPTYVWGQGGSGKSHLLRAAQAALRDQGCAVGWMDASVSEPTVFDDAWRVVILDDVHLYNAVQQHAAFNWFVNAMTPDDGQQRWVLSAGEAPPTALMLREDLRTRLGWGHIFQLQVLSEPERRAVLRQQADERGVFLSDEVMDFMLKRFSRDLSSLIQLLDQLDGYALQTQRAITIPLLKSMLEAM
jgi:DnaA-homolog protein